MNNAFQITFKDGHDTTQGLQAAEKLYIEHVYALSKYNQSKAARMLGLSRGCLRMKLDAYFPGKYL